MPSCLVKGQVTVRSVLAVVQEADVTREALHDMSREARRLREYILATDDEDITTLLHTSEGEEEVQHGHPIHLSHGGGPVQLKLEPISGFRTSLS